MTDQERIEEIENHVKRGYHLIVNSTDDMKFLLQQLADRDKRIVELVVGGNALADSLFSVKVDSSDRKGVAHNHANIMAWRKLFI